MKKLIMIIMSIFVLVAVSGCSSQNNCDCAQTNIYRQPISSNVSWIEGKNLYDILPKNAEVIQIIKTTTDSHFPQYDVIYTIHNCGK